MTVRAGTIYLVGAGPGDPKLITVRGREILQTADAVIHDRLVSPGLLELARAEARIENVGKAPGGAGPSQAEINDLLVNLARDGYAVCRLKCGDPFVFGRGGEELLAGRAAGVFVEVVPGVTAAVAGPAAAGVPVTHRGVSSSVTVVTGHEEPGATDGGMDWSRIAQVPGSIVIMMGVAHIDAISRALVSSGRSSDEPVCVVERATFQDQRILFGTLGTIGEVARSSTIDNPATIVIGAVVDALVDSPEL